MLKDKKGAKIGMLLDKPYPPDPRVENEALALIQKGYQVFLFCLTFGGEKKEEIIHGIHVKRYTTNALEYKLSALVYTIPLYSYYLKKKIKKFINQYPIEILHIHDMVVAEAAFKANENKKLPVVLDLHENRPEIMKYYPHLQKFPGNMLISTKKWKQKEEEFIRKTNELIVVTEAAKKEIINRVGVEQNKITVVPNTVRKSFYEKENVMQNKNNKNNFTLLYIGDTADRRGLQTAIESIPQLKEEIPNICLVIVGTPNKKLTDIADKLQLQSYIDFKGWQDESKFKEFIENSDICISPLHRNIHHDTTYANKIFQYMSLGKPVLVSNAIAQKELIEKIQAGLVHEEKNTEDFTNKVLTLYRDKEKRIMYGKKGEKFVKTHFHWGITSQALIELYNRL